MSSRTTRPTHPPTRPGSPIRDPHPPHLTFQGLHLTLYLDPSANLCHLAHFVLVLYFGVVLGFANAVSWWCKGVPVNAGNFLVSEYCFAVLRRVTGLLSNMHDRLYISDFGGRNAYIVRSVGGC